MECKNCDGPAHPATGHHLGGESWLCGICAGRFLAWVIRHTGKKAARRQRKQGFEVSFYQAAATSIRPEEGR